MYYLYTSRYLSFVSKLSIFFQKFSNLQLLFPIRKGRVHYGHSPQIFTATSLID